MNITASLFNMYHICKREMWLHAHQINMEHTSDLVSEGKMIHENSYAQRANKAKEVHIGGSVIDYYDAQEKIIHETKKSNAKEEAHIWQLRFYIYLFEQEGISGVSGILEYPKLRERIEVFLDDESRQKLLFDIQTAEEVMQQESCPPRLKQTKCKNCSYYDFCWISEQ